MSAAVLPRKRKPRGRAPTPVVVTVSFQRVPVAEFARSWARVIHRFSNPRPTTPRSH